MSSGAPSREGQGSGNETSGAGGAATQRGEVDEAGGGSTQAKMTFADENEADPEDVYAKADGIRVPYDKNDPIYWFRRLEIQMEIRGIQSQFWKRIVLESNLPPDINETIKDLLVKERNEAGSVYKDCKARILKIFGPKPEQDFTLALGLVMTGLPSQAAKRVKELVCKRNFDCCCPAVVGKIWRDMLPKDVRVAVASYDLAKQWDEALDRADNVHNALQSFLKAEARGTKAQAEADVKEVAAVKLDKPPDEAGPEDDVFDINDRQTWGRYHSDFKRNPPKTICFQHYRWGKQAHFCRGLGECPWESYTAPHSK